MSEVTEKISIPTKVTIKASRKHGWLPEGHDGAHRFSNTEEHLTIQRARNTGILNTGMDDETAARLEKKLNLKPGALSRNNGDYWKKFKIAIPKGGIVLNPQTNPTDEVAYYVALAHQEIANSVAENKQGKWAFSRYEMHSDEEETATVNNEVNIKLDAYKRFGELTENEKRNFLKVYGKSAGKDTSLDFINGQVGKIVDSEPKTFLDIVNNPNYKVQVFIKDCLEAGILKESGGKYIMHGGDVLAYSTDQMIDYLKNSDNSEIATQLKGQLSAIK